MWHLKDCIERMEKELREWEKEVKQRYDISDKQEE
jgi:hypothetical protein